MPNPDLAAVATIICSSQSDDLSQGCCHQLSSHLGCRCCTPRWQVPPLQSSTTTRQTDLRK